MDIRISFPGGKRVDAAFGGHVLKTDQSVAHGGAGEAPEPFDLFLASLATCAGIYALGFCQARGLSTEGLDLVQQAVFDEDAKKLLRVELRLTLPPTFPEKYRPAILRAIEGCKVKKTLLDPPSVLVVDTGAAASSEGASALAPPA